MHLRSPALPLIHRRKWSIGIAAEKRCQSLAIPVVVKKGSWGDALNHLKTRLPQLTALLNLA